MMTLALTHVMTSKRIVSFYVSVTVSIKMLKFDDSLDVGTKVTCQRILFALTYPNWCTDQGARQ